MKECMECGKKLGIIEGYNHPTKGKEYLLCSSCFDTVSVSVDKWNEFISPYIGFFNKESSASEDMQKIRQNITNGIKNVQSRVNKLLSHNTNQNINDNLTTVSQHNIDTYSV